MTTDRMPFRALDPEVVSDGDYVVTVANGFVTGLAAAASGGSGGAVPAGGSTGQVLKKASAADGDVVWAADLQGAGGGGGGYPPGSADEPPAVANAKDDEFDGTSQVTWTANPTAPATWTIGDRDGHLHLAASGSGGAYVGKTQPVPAAYPYTITTKLTGSTGRANFNRAGGIIIGPANPTPGDNLLYCGAVYNNNRIVQRVVAQFGGTFVSQTGTGTFVGNHGTTYLKVVVASATNVSTYVSADGWAWTPIETGFNPGFTPAVMGLACSEEGTAGAGVDAYFDFFRVS